MNLTKHYCFHEVFRFRQTATGLPTTAIIKYTSTLLSHVKNGTAFFFSEAGFWLAALNISVEGRPLSLPGPALLLRCASYDHKPTNHGILASLSLRTNPELPTDMLLRRKKVPFLFDVIELFTLTSEQKIKPCLSYQVRPSNSGISFTNLGPIA